MTGRAFRWLSIALAALPLSAGGRESLKAFVYRRFGRFFTASPNYAAWLRQNPTREAPTLAVPPVAPSEEEWSRLRGFPTGNPDTVRAHESTAASAARRSVYLFVPVYKGYAQTLRCLHRLRVSAPATRLVVLIDASPDRRLRRALRRKAAEGHFELLENSQNQGFARAVNVGFSLDDEADVVLVNSDTEAYGDWLSRLRDAAYQNDRVGTVTPLSNHGDIASYPVAQHDNRRKLELSPEDIDALCREVNRGVSVVAPTGVGFCLYIRRDCIRRVGRFDDAFRDGYGEENDFCLRARAAGFEHRIAADVFVRHHGAISFGARAIRLRERAFERLAERYPGYPEEIATFVAADPLRPSRLRVDVARLRRSVGLSAPSHGLLLVVHDWGGGVEAHVCDLARRLHAENVAVYVLRTRRDSEDFRFTLGPRPGVEPLRDLSTLESISMGSVHEMVSALAQLEIELVHFHHGGELMGESPGWLSAICDALGTRYDVTLHDYGAFCPRLHLEAPLGQYCGEPAVSECKRCLERLGHGFGDVDLDAWRDRWRSFLAGARHVYCPTADVRARFQRRWPEVSLVVRAHPEPATDPTVWSDSVRAATGEAGATSRSIESAQRLRVIVPGAINDQKGFRILTACSEDSRKRGLPIEFVVVGYTCDDGRAKRAGIRVTGRFDPAEMDHAILAAYRTPSLVWLPSVTPETWSFVLSATLRVGLYPVVFGLGALAERVTEAGRGTVVPIEAAQDPGGINDVFLGLSTGPDLERRPDVALPGTRYVSISTDYYGGFGAAQGRTTKPEPWRTERDGRVE